MQQLLLLEAIFRSKPRIFNNRDDEDIFNNHDNENVFNNRDGENIRCRSSVKHNEIGIPDTVTDDMRRFYQVMARPASLDR